MAEGGGRVVHYSGLKLACRLDAGLFVFVSHDGWERCLGDLGDAGWELACEGQANSGGGLGGLWGLGTP